MVMALLRYITISVKNCTNVTAKVFVILRIAILSVIVILTRVTSWSKWRHLQTKVSRGTRAINDGRKLLEMKVQNTSSNVCDR